MPGKSESYLAELDTVSYPYEMTGKVLIRVVFVSLLIATGKGLLIKYVIQGEVAEEGGIARR